MPVRLQTAHPRIRTEALSPREREVILWLQQGLTDEDIARALGLSTVTVRNHMARIREKLHCRIRVQVLRVAQERGLL